ncbi:methyltransferase [Vibrio tapetis subsp. quintayensis]|uniref:tRNA1(Val) (adenine(37)-N6)-methyltransferase n=1 Tax=Vibrio tapetis TaxID=52443 RepID=UPI0025B44C8A|nr:methyltransferase [Vibrio tapetis]MDN3682735.1 methyltransferase [Vibrio tapetis subsp. quintayensis]
MDKRASNQKTAITKDFNFKQFSIYGGMSGMPVSTDGVLLGAWSNIENSKKILDIGTGTGLLALMSAQRNRQAGITAIELNNHAYHAAAHNFTHSQWHDRLTLKHQNILTWQPKATFDHIICNPPYFNHGEQARVQQRAVARHTDTLPHQELLLKAWDLLDTHGSASFILPKMEGTQFIDLSLPLGWHLSRYCEVKTSTRKPVSRLLFELSKKPSETLINELVIHTQEQYSDDFISLTRDFYLKM